MNQKNSIAYKISRIRFELNLKQGELAPKTEVSQSTISKIEKSQRIPDYNFLNKLIVEFNINPMYLFGNNEEIFQRK